MKSLGLFSRNLRGDFFLKIGILSVKVYTKKVSNIEECNFIHVPLRLLTSEQVIEVLYLYRVNHHKLIFLILLAFQYKWYPKNFYVIFLFHGLGHFIITIINFKIIWASARNGHLLLVHTIQLVSEYWVQFFCSVQDCSWQKNSQPLQPILE